MILKFIFLPFFVIGGSFSLNEEKGSDCSVNSTSEFFNSEGFDNCKNLEAAFRLLASEDLIYNSTDYENDSTLDVEGRSHRCVGDPLFLTPYIEAGRLQEGREKATVSLFGYDDVKSYSGFLTVNKKYNSNLFFWFFESEYDPSAPLLVWLQGGPGVSSLYGLFLENGPFALGEDGVSKREIYWSSYFNVLYIDNPVGTGFSFTDDDEGYARNQIDVGIDLYNMIVQFLQLFPHLQKNDFFISGESYAGKYIPAFAHRIHKENQKDMKAFEINLKGLFIGNGYTDPINMMNYGDYLYQLGLIDNVAKINFHRLEALAVESIRKKNWKAANFFIGAVLGTANYLTRLSPYNYYQLTASTEQELAYINKFINRKSNRKSIHVGNLTFHNGNAVYRNLLEDLPQSVIEWVVELVDYYQIVFYNGQLDIICAYPLTDNVLENMRWRYIHDFKNAVREPYFADHSEIVMGYRKSFHNLHEIMIRDAGHMVPADQPAWALQMYKDYAEKARYL